MLISLSNQLSRSAWRRHLCFGLVSAVTIFVAGYHFGTFDQSIHIPFLKKFSDPSLYPGNEALLNLRFQHYSFFWFFFIPFYRLGILELALFFTHFVATYLTFWRLWELSQTLFNDALAGLLTLVVMIIPHIGFSAFPIFEFDLLNRTFVLPFLFWAMDLYLRRRYFYAFTLLGVLANLHVLSAAYIFFLFILALVADFKQIGWKRAAGYLAGFGVAASPVLVWRGLGSPPIFTLNPDWFQAVAQGMFFHLNYLIAPFPHIWLVTLSALSGLVLFVIAWRRRLSPEHDRIIAVFMAGILSIILVQQVSVYTRPITIMVQTQIMRVGMLAVVLAYLYAAGYLARLYRARAMSSIDLTCLLIAFAMGIFSFIPLMVWFIQKVIKPARWRALLSGLTIVVLITVSFGLSLYYGIWKPGIYIYTRPTPWHATQVWARQHTPKEALFITPLHLWWFFDAEWRVFSERSQVVAFSDLLEIAIVPDYFDEWARRFDDFAPGIRAQFRGNIFENLAMIRQAYIDLPDETLLKLADKYGATYIVIEKPHTRPWKRIFENEQFIIYEIER